MRVARSLDGPRREHLGVLDRGVLRLDTATKIKTMRISTTFGAAILALTALASGCAMLGGETSGGGVYLVGVAGGG